MINAFWHPGDYANMDLEIKKELVRIGTGLKI